MRGQAYHNDIVKEDISQKKGKIVFAMIEAGGGHKSPAIAVQEAVHTLYDDTYDIFVVDFMKHIGCTELDAKHKETWKFFLAHPFICKSSHILADLAGPFFRVGLKQWLNPLYSYVLQFLIKNHPSVMFSTHPFNSYAIEYVRRKFNIPVVLINYLTELFDVSSLWIVKGVDYFIVASEEAKRKLALRGIPRDKIRVFGYPVRRSFLNVNASKDEIASRLNIDSSRKTLLMSFGKEGIGNIEGFIDALKAQGIPLNVIVVSGENEALRQRLSERYPPTGPDRSSGRSTKVHVLGFTDRMHELIHLSDFCFIKPGPSTLMEAATLKKPILFYKAAQISESPNIKFAVDNGIGFYIGDNIRRFIKITRSLTEGRAAEEVQRAYSILKIHNGAYDIARFVVETAFESSAFER